MPLLNALPYEVRAFAIDLDLALLATELTHFRFRLPI